MQRWKNAIVLAMLSGLSGTALSADIEVMTQNQYLGADLTPIIEAATDPESTPADVNAAIIAALAKVAANLPEQRFEALAKLINTRAPHLVGVQEVFQFSCQGPGCSDPAISGAFVDHLEGTLDALDGKYVLEAQVRNLNLTLQFLSTTGFGQVTVIDRDVILARADVADEVSSANFDQLCLKPVRASLDGCNYETVAPVTLPGVGEVRVERGYVGVNATIEGVDYLFVNTHLEVREPNGEFISRFVQARQAAELIEFLQTKVPASDQLLVVGDINSSPDDKVVQVAPGVTLVPPYAQFLIAGFTDVWKLRPGAMTGKGAPLVGFSCCQEEELGNHRSVLEERIDVIFSLNAPKKVKQARLLGESISDKTAPPPFGLWPSDHASVAALLQF